MKALRKTLVFTGVLLALSLAPGASAVIPPAGTPDLSRMALRASDLPTGARVAKQRYVKPDRAIAEYDREFREGTARAGRVRLLALENDVEIHKTADEASLLFRQFKSVTTTKSGRQTLARFFAAGFASSTGSSALGKLKVTTGLPVNLHIGNESLAVAFSVKTALGTLHVVLAVHRVDRVVSLVSMSGGFDVKLSTSAARPMVAAIVQHIHDGLVPLNVTAPSISGTAQVGQTLTAVAGTWTNSPTQFAYQWQRCDATGANCLAITGATAHTYVVQATDVSATLRVTETATNSLGAATSISAQTAVVIG